MTLLFVKAAGKASTGKWRTTMAEQFSGKVKILDSRSNVIFELDADQGTIIIKTAVGAQN